MVKRDLERIGVPDHTKDGTVDYHAIGRCSYITQLLVNGVPIHQAMKLARHHSVEMTQRYAKCVKMKRSRPYRSYHPLHFSVSGKVSD
jgi:site-specific recombinase XerD